MNLRVFSSWIKGLVGRNELPLKTKSFEQKILIHKNGKKAKFKTKIGRDIFRTCPLYSVVYLIWNINLVVFVLTFPTLIQANSTAGAGQRPNTSLNENNLSTHFGLGTTSNRRLVNDTVIRSNLSSNTDDNRLNSLAHANVHQHRNNDEYNRRFRHRESDNKIDDWDERGRNMHPPPPPQSEKRLLPFSISSSSAPTPQNLSKTFVHGNGSSFIIDKYSSHVFDLPGHISTHPFTWRTKNSKKNRISFGFRKLIPPFLDARISITNTIQRPNSIKKDKLFLRLGKEIKNIKPNPKERKLQNIATPSRSNNNISFLPIEKNGKLNKNSKKTYGEIDFSVAEATFNKEEVEEAHLGTFLSHQLTSSKNKTKKGRERTKESNYSDYSVANFSEGELHTQKNIKMVMKKDKYLLHNSKMNKKSREAERGETVVFKQLRVNTGSWNATKRDASIFVHLNPLSWDQVRFPIGFSDKIHSQISATRNKNLFHYVTGRPRQNIVSLNSPNLFGNDIKKRFKNKKRENKYGRRNYYRSSRENKRPEVTFNLKRNTKCRSTTQEIMALRNPKDVITPLKNFNQARFLLPAVPKKEVNLSIMQLLKEGGGEGAAEGRMGKADCLERMSVEEPFNTSQTQHDPEDKRPPSEEIGYFEDKRWSVMNDSFRQNNKTQFIENHLEIPSTGINKDIIDTNIVNRIKRSSNSGEKVVFQSFSSSTTTGSILRNKEDKIVPVATSSVVPSTSTNSTVWISVTNNSKPVLPDRIKHNNKYGNNRIRKKIKTVKVEVLMGETARLPCDLSVQQLKNSVQLVFWIKEGMHMPLYSYDYRELQDGRPKETKPDSKSPLAKRTRFDIVQGGPSELTIEKVVREDTGIYRCRVDYLVTPTRNTRVNLTVVVPPSRAIVSWRLSASNTSQDVVAPSGSIGPFKENDEPILVCSNDDGFPPPKVIWYEGSTAIDDTFFFDTEESDEDKHLVTNEMELSPLTRKDFARRFTCQVTNANSSQPATATVSLAMILNIQDVKIDIPEALRANVQMEITCDVWGSKPSAYINWWIGSTKMTPIDYKEEGNLTRSYLQFKPHPDDDGAMLICQAVNPEIPDEVIQDTKLLSIKYVPSISVHLGRSLDARRIKEGDDVYFECSVKAKPPAFKVTWKHNGVLLNDGYGVFVSNMSLVVQRVNRTNGGDYTCHATNAVGVGVSHPLHLDVKYAPVCAIADKKQHSVAKLENAEILCSVHANPPAVTFRWTFNNTAEAIDVPEGRFVVTGTDSRVNYTPMNELDYGTLLCWANNTIGIQENPCVFQIVAAGKPDPPHNCNTFDITISSLQVTCLPGDNGGLRQEFLIQVFKIGSSSPTTEISRPTPSFSVQNLRPATAYKILVASLNDKGASRPAELKAYTVQVPETQEETSAEPTRDRDRDKTLPLTIIIGSSVAAVPVILIISFVIWFRTCRRSTSKSEPVKSFSNRRFNNSNSLNASDSHQTMSYKDISLERSSLDLSNEEDATNSTEMLERQDGKREGKTVCDVSIISKKCSGYYLGNEANTEVMGRNRKSNSMDHTQQSSTFYRNDNLSQAKNNNKAYSPYNENPPTHVDINPSSMRVPYQLQEQENVVVGAHNMLDITIPPPETFKRGYRENEVRTGFTQAVSNVGFKSTVSPSSISSTTPFSHLLRQQEVQNFEKSENQLPILRTSQDPMKQTIVYHNKSSASSKYPKSNVIIKDRIIAGSNVDKRSPLGFLNNQQNSAQDSSSSTSTTQSDYQHILLADNTNKANEEKPIHSKNVLHYGTLGRDKISSSNSSRNRDVFELALDDSSSNPHMRLSFKRNNEHNV